MSGCWPGATGRQTLRCSGEQGVGGWADHSAARRAGPRLPLCADGRASGAGHLNGFRAPTQPKGAPQVVHLLVRARRGCRAARGFHTPI